MTPPPTPPAPPGPAEPGAAAPGSSGAERASVAPEAGDAELRATRRCRIFDAMVAAGLDVLVLGRRDSVAYAIGARSLWTAGTRPFGAACVLVAGPRSIHLLSSWDAGVPPDVPFAHLYGITWNPATMAASLSAIPGLADAGRIGVDALTPGFERAAHRLAPEAELVAVDDLLRRVRALKLAGEVERIRAAVAIAAAGVEAATAALANGALAAQARATALGAMAAHGVTVPSSTPVVRVVDPVRSLVHVDVGVLVDGYEGGLGRTVAVPTSPPDARPVVPPEVRSDVGPGSGSVGGSTGTTDADPDTHSDLRVDEVAAAQRRLLDACRPGATAQDLREAARRISRWMVRGCGMGFEPPVVTERLGEGTMIEEGMVLSVEVDVDGVRRRDLARVGADAVEVF